MGTILHHKFYIDDLFFQSMRGCRLMIIHSIWSILWRLNLIIIQNLYKSSDKRGLEFWIGHWIVYFFILKILTFSLNRLPKHKRDHSSRLSPGLFLVIYSSNQSSVPGVFLFNGITNKKSQGQNWKCKQFKKFFTKFDQSKREKMWQTLMNSYQEKHTF